jgi:hypothetical protein
MIPLACDLSLVEMEDGNVAREQRAKFRTRCGIASS